MADYYVTTSGSDSNAGTSEALAFATPGKAASVMSALGGDTVYIKSGTYLHTTGTASVAGGPLKPPAGARGAPNRVIGYHTSIGDLAGDSDFSLYPILRATSSGASPPLQCGDNYVHVSNLACDANGVTDKSVDWYGAEGLIVNLKGMGAVLRVSQRSHWIRCWATGSGSGAEAGWHLEGDAIYMEGCLIEGNACPGILAYGCRGAILHCRITGNTGTSSDGIQIIDGSPYLAIIGCTIHGNGRDGIRFDRDQSLDMTTVRNNVITSNGGYGMRSAVTSYSVPLVTIGYNSFYNNTSGNYSGVQAGTNDVVLSGDPYVNSSSGDFRLNSTSGAGAACRGVASPQTFPGQTSQSSYGDLGAYQSQGSGGGSTTVYQVVSPGIIWGTS